jgi:Icc protein
MTFRLAHISDPHLSAERPFFVDNFARVAAHIAADPPDLVINTGDMSLDGVQRESDLEEARRLHDALGVPCRCIPGNHDLGEAQDAPPHPASVPITAERRARYIKHFGQDYWHLDVPGWRLVALNAQLLGSDLAEAAAQMDFLRGAVETGRRVALFIHKPLFHDSPQENVISGRFINPAPRHVLLEVLASHPPALVCSGHVHQFLSKAMQGAQHVWAPSTGFILPDARQPVYGLKQTGYVAHRFEPDGTCTSQLVVVPNLPTLTIADFPTAYGAAI